MEHKSSLGYLSGHLIQAQREILGHSTGLSYFNTFALRKIKAHEKF